MYLCMTCHLLTSCVDIREVILSFRLEVAAASNQVILSFRLEVVVASNQVILSFCLEVVVASNQVILSFCLEVSAASDPRHIQSVTDFKIILKTHLHLLR